MLSWSLHFLYPILSCRALEKTEESSSLIIGLTHLTQHMSLSSSIRQSAATLTSQAYKPTTKPAKSKGNCFHEGGGGKLLLSDEGGGGSSGWEDEDSSAYDEEDEEDGGDEDEGEDSFGKHERRVQKLCRRP